MTPPILFPSVGASGRYHHSTPHPGPLPSEGRERKHRAPWPGYFTLRDGVSLTPGFSPVDGRAFGSKLFQQFVTRRQAVETAQPRSRAPFTGLKPGVKETVDRSVKYPGWRMRGPASAIGGSA